MRRAQAVAVAREWLGTPYQHQASLNGAGTDCLGLIRGIWRTLYDGEPVEIPAYTSDWSEPSREERLLNEARRLLVPVSGRLEPGQVLVFRMRDLGVAKHLGLVSSCGARPAFIHAYTGHGVIESPLSLPWRRRVVAQFEFP